MTKWSIWEKGGGEVVTGVLITSAACLNGEDSVCPLLHFISCSVGLGSLNCIYLPGCSYTYAVVYT